MFAQKSIKPHLMLKVETIHHFSSSRFYTVLYHKITLYIILLENVEFTVAGTISTISKHSKSYTCTMYTAKH